MSTKTPKRTNDNGKSKGGSGASRTVARDPASKASVLTERAWKKTYENRHKTKTAA